MVEYLKANPTAIIELYGIKNMSTGILGALVYEQEQDTKAS